MTYRITLAHSYPINVALLDEELADALGARFAGITTRPGAVAVLFTDTPTAEEEATVRHVQAAHDARNLSRAEARTRSRRATLAALTAADEPLALADFAAQPPALRKLARKVILLEALVRGIDINTDNNDA
jgi:hypothetical protein